MLTQLHMRESGQYPEQEGLAFPRGRPQMLPCRWPLLTLDQFLGSRSPRLNLDRLLPKLNNKSRVRNHLLIIWHSQACIANPLKLQTHPIGVQILFASVRVPTPIPCWTQTRQGAGVFLLSSIARRNIQREAMGAIT